MKPFDFFVEEISEIFNKTRSKALLIISITVIGVTLYPFFDSYYLTKISGLEKQIALLEQINKSELTSNRDSTAIKEKFEKIVSEVLNNPIDITDAWKQYFERAEKRNFSDMSIQFISGGFIGIIMLLFFYFNYRKKNVLLFTHKSITMDFIGILSLWLVCSIIGLLIPKFNHFYLNYLFIPAC
ncbi:MAG: hypothetical protein RR356_08680, partial [Bacteroidales bacterium]